MDGNTAYCAFLNGLVVLDLDGRAFPVFALRALPRRRLRHRQVRIVRLSSPREKRGSKIVDVSIRGTPPSRVKPRTGGDGQGGGPGRPAAFVADGTAGLQVLRRRRDRARPDASPPSTRPGDAEGITLRARRPTSPTGTRASYHRRPGPGRTAENRLLRHQGTARQTALTGRPCSIANGASGLAVLDIGDPAAPNQRPRPDFELRQQRLHRGPARLRRDALRRRLPGPRSPRPGRSGVPGYQEVHDVQRSLGCADRRGRRGTSSTTSPGSMCRHHQPRQPRRRGLYRTPSSITPPPSRATLSTPSESSPGSRLRYLRSHPPPSTRGIGRSRGASRPSTSRGRYAYVTERRVINISTFRRSPRKDRPSSPPARRAAGRRRPGTYAYLTSDHYGFHVVDIGDPKAPKMTGSLEMPGFAYGLTVDGAGLPLQQRHGISCSGHFRPRRAETPAALSARRANPMPPR